MGTKSEQMTLLSTRFSYRDGGEENLLLGWAVTFLIIPLIAALLGFGMIAGVAIEAAKIVFFVAIVLFAISAIAGLMRGGRPTLP
jgi:uncharacterized membrane protein YtjA (UPF0391 family)